MKIDPNTLGLPQTQTNPAGTGRASSSRNIEQIYGLPAGSTSRTDGSATGDEVQLSDLSSALRMLSTDSPERAARLEELSKLVASGGYKVDAQELSRSLADEYYSEPLPEAATGQAGGEDA